VESSPAAFKKACEGREANLGSEFTCGSGDIRPLYFNTKDYNIRLLSEEGAEEAEEAALSEIIPQIGLEYVLKRLIEQAEDGLAKDGPLQRRAILSSLYNATGRPGEAKFIDTANWQWHSRFELTNIMWAQMKTLSLHGMGVIF